MRKRALNIAVLTGSLVDDFRRGAMRYGCVSGCGVGNVAVKRGSVFDGPGLDLASGHSRQAACRRINIMASILKASVIVRTGAAGQWPCTTSSTNANVR